MKSIVPIASHHNIQAITTEGLRSRRSPTKLKAPTGTTGKADWVWIQLPPKTDRVLRCEIGHNRPHVEGVNFRPSLVHLFSPKHIETGDDTPTTRANPVYK
jgi:hypothetical protein